MSEKMNILMIDDDPGKLLTYEAILSELGENLIKATSGKEALDLLLKNEVAVVLMDVNMPDINGFDLTEMIRQHPRFQKTAIIFISAVHLSDPDKLQGYQRGGMDYISVPVVPELLRAKVSVFADLHRKTRELEILNDKLDAFNRELEQRVLDRTEQLRQSQAQLRLTQKVARIATWELDIEAEQYTWSGEALEMLGQPDLGRKQADFLSLMFYSADRENVQNTLKHATTRSKEFEVQFRILRSDGQARWIAARGVPFYNQGKGLVLGVFIDITEAKTTISPAKGTKVHPTKSRKNDHKKSPA